MYIISGVTGNTGRVVASTLLKMKKPVRVIVRSAEKGEPWSARGAEVAVASLDDADAVERALDGAQGLYYLIPPDLRASDGLAYSRRMADTLSGVLARSPLPHVAFLSSIGAHQESGTGPIRGLHYAETMFKALGIPFTFIRAAYFMENTESSLPVVKQQGILPAFFSTDKRIPMVAAQDVGETAARALLEPPGSTQVVELAGPAEYSMNEVAEAYSRVLGKRISAVRVPQEGIVPALMQAGISASVADLIREMSEGIEHDIVNYEGGDARFTRGRVTIDEFVTKVVGTQSLAA